MCLTTCPPVDRGDRVHIGVDERLPLLLKQNKNRTMKSPRTPPGTGCRSGDGGDTPCGLRIRRILNRLSWLAAVVGIARFCYLVSKGEYYTWAVPLLLSASVCKLLTTSTPTSCEHYPYERYAGYQPRASVVAAAGRRARHRLRQTAVVRTLSSLSLCLKRRFDNDNHSNAVFLSLLLVVAPCVTYFISKAGPVLDPVIDSLLDRDSRRLHEGNHHEGGLDHERMADYLGRLGAAGLAFLLVPVSKSSSIFLALGWSEVHALRLHICAGCILLLGGIAHGLYYTYIWIAMEGYSYREVFPSRECWGGLWARDYDKGCHSKLVNFTGIVTGLALLALGLTSLHWVRRRFYRLFYIVHVVVSIILLFGLAMHYNKMILYIAPSFLYYLGSNMPVHVESLLKWRRSRRGGGVEVSKAVCIPDSGGCVELTFPMSDDEAKEASTPRGRTAVVDRDRTEADLRALRNNVGRYVNLHVPELSLQSHPFTTFSDPGDPSGSLRLLFRPSGSFTTGLLTRFKELASMPEPTPSEMENHRSICSRGDEKCPTVLVNGVRSATTDMFERATSHDRVLIVAGGVGIVTYISLIHALRLQVHLAMAHRTSSGKNNYGGHYLGDEATNGNSGSFDNEDVEVGVPIDNPPVAKRVDVHWMTRDEGLVRHVLHNYFQPFADEGVSDKDSPPLLINLVVHHTSPGSSSSPDDVEANGHDGEATTTWSPRRRRRQQDSESGDEGVGRWQPPFSSPASAYEGNKPTLSQNLIPSLALASIAFGGLWIVNYCYDQVQDKHTIETRNIPVAGALILALAVSLLSNAALAAAAALHARRFRYCKLDEGGSSKHGDVGNGGGGEIEFDKVVNAGVAKDRFSIDGEDDTAADTDSDGYSANGHSANGYSVNGHSVNGHSANGHSANGHSANGLHPDPPPPSSASLETGRVECDGAVLRISHARGRPNLATIVREAMTKGEGEDAFPDDEVLGRGGDRTDLGIFMCGPTAMCNAVQDAVKKEEGARGPCGSCKASGRTPTALYPEVFEM